MQTSAHKVKKPKIIRTRQLTGTPTGRDISEILDYIRGSVGQFS